MQINKLRLVNFCQHRDRELIFRPGLTGIIGPNGSGKSNILGAVKYALTGDNPNAGTKLQNICHDAGADERSYVELAFSHGSASAVVRRHLRPATPTTLEVDGAVDISGDRAVNAYILDMLQTDRQILSDIVIVDQLDVFGFLARQPAQRVASFAKLFHTDAAEEIWALLGKKISETRVPVVTDDAAVVRAAIAEGERKLQQIQAKLDGNTSQQVRSTIEKNQDIIRGWDRRNELANRLEQLRREQAQQLESHAQFERAVSMLQTQVEETQRYAQERYADLLRLKDVATEAVRYTEYMRQLRTYSAAISQYEQQLQDIAEPPTPLRYGEDVKNEVLAVSSELHKWSQFVESFDPSTGIAECPTCHTPVTTLQPALIEARVRVEELRKTLNELSDLFQSHSDYTARMTQIIERRRILADALSNNRDKYKQLRASADQFMPRVVAPTAQQMSEADKAYYDATQSHSVASSNLGAARTNLQWSTNKLKELEEQLLDCERCMAYISTSQAQYEAARRCNDYLKPRLDSIIVAEREQAVVSAKLDADRQLLVKCESVAMQAAMTESWLQRLQRLRDVLHRDAAPKAVVQHSLTKLQNDVNEYLEMFGADYRVSSNLDLSFTAHLHSGQAQPAERLSVGQKVILALSFRLAVNFMYANLSFVVLDEPTAYLDERHIAGFVPVLQKLQAFTSSRGLQCIIVTHERALTPLFDFVVDLYV